MRLCENCGKPLSGQQEYFCCPQCAIEMKRKETKEANALLGKGHFNINKTIKEKVCEDCGAKYMGYPRSKRCPTCNVAAKKKRKKEYEERKKNGKSRVIGGTAYCEICGKPYIINGGLQVMCADCAAEQTRKRALDYYKRNAEEAKQRKKESYNETQKKMEEIRVRLCPTCGKTFTPNKAHRVYCSDACADAKALKASNLPAKKQHGSLEKPRKYRKEKTEASKARIAAGFTVARLSEIVHLSERTIRNYENGKKVSDESRAAIDEVLKINKK